MEKRGNFLAILQIIVLIAWLYGYVLVIIVYMLVNCGTISFVLSSQISSE